jgi:hypothetical protein
LGGVPATVCRSQRRFDSLDVAATTAGMPGIDENLCYAYCAKFVATGNVVRGQMQQPEPGRYKNPGRGEK